MADIALAALPVTPSRENYIDFTIPFTQSIGFQLVVNRQSPLRDARLVKRRIKCDEMNRCSTWYDVARMADQYQVEFVDYSLRSMLSEELERFHILYERLLKSSLADSTETVPSCRLLFSRLDNWRRCWR